MKQSPQWIYQRLLPARAHRESDQGAALPRDLPHQLHQLLANLFHSYSTPQRTFYPTCACGHRYRLCPRATWPVARTTAEARRSGLSLRTTRPRPSARFLPVSTRLPSCGSGAQRPPLNPFPFTRSTQFHTDTSRPLVSPFCNLNIPILELFNSFAPLPDQPQLSALQPPSHQSLVLAMSSLIILEPKILPTKKKGPGCKERSGSHGEEWRSVFA